MSSKRVFATDDDVEEKEEKIPSFLPQKGIVVKKERFFKRTQGDYLM